LILQAFFGKEGDRLAREDLLEEPVEDIGVVETPATIAIVATEDDHFDSPFLADCAAALVPRTI
jgi:hypothetical protein